MMDYFWYRVGLYGIVVYKDGWCGYYIGEAVLERE